MSPRPNHGLILLLEGKRDTIYLSFTSTNLHSIGGMTAAALTSPLDVLKTRLQSDFYQAQLRELHARTLQDDVPVTFDITIHATASTSADDSLDREESYEMQAVKSTEGPWTIHMGRPNVAAWLSQVKGAHIGVDAAINVCGPRALINETRKAAGAASSENGIFYVEEEVFEL